MQLHVISTLHFLSMQHTYAGPTGSYPGDSLRELPVGETGRERRGGPQTQVSTGNSRTGIGVLSYRMTEIF